MAIVRINHFQAAQGKVEQLHDFLNSLLPYITNSEGCLACEVLQASDNRDEFVVIEKWQSKEDHQNSLANFPKDDMQAAMILFAQPPHGSYYLA